MSKKTLFFIITLLIITVSVLMAAFLQNKPTSKTPPTTPTPVVSLVPSPAPIAQTVLSFSPNPLVIASQSATMAVTINTGINMVTAVQLELTFDPKTITAVDITPGTFFTNSVSLLKHIDTKNGKISYVLAVSPIGQAKTGKDVIAILSFTTNLESGQKTEIKFSPKTLVTAEGIPTSVLKATESPATIFYVRQQVGATGQAPIGPVKPGQ